MAIGLMLILFGAVLQPRCRARENQRHRKVCVTDGRPAGGRLKSMKVRAFFVLVDGRRRQVLYLVADGGYCFRRDSIEVVMFDSLVGNIWPDGYFSVGNGLTGL